MSENIHSGLVRVNVLERAAWIGTLNDSHKAIREYLGRDADDALAIRVREIYRMNGGYIEQDGVGAVMWAGLPDENKEAWRLLASRLLQNIKPKVLEKHYIVVANIPAEQEKPSA
jgi:hypothetical protein